MSHGGEKKHEEDKEANDDADAIAEGRDSGGLDLASLFFLLYLSPPHDISTCRLRVPSTSETRGEP